MLRLDLGYGYTITSTLWRAIEVCDSPTFGLVSQHPHYISADKPTIRYFVVSRSFKERFSAIGSESVFKAISQHCTHRKAGPLANEEVVVTDDNGLQHRYLMECFSNRYDVLTLGTCLGVVSEKVSVGNGK